MVHSCIVNGCNNKSNDPQCTGMSWHRVTLTTDQHCELFICEECMLKAQCLWSSSGWQCIDHPSFKLEACSNYGFNFTIANMFSYFIHRRALDGKPTNDFKDLNNKAFPLYKAGHIQNLVFKVSASE